MAGPVDAPNDADADAPPAPLVDTDAAPLTNVDAAAADRGVASASVAVQPAANSAVFCNDVVNADDVHVHSDNMSPNNVHSA